MFPPPGRQSRQRDDRWRDAQYLERGEVKEPPLDVAGVPPRDQAPLLQGSQLGGRAGPGRDHLVEAEPQRRGVLVGSLMLRGEGGELIRAAPRTAGTTAAERRGGPRSRRQESPAPESPAPESGPIRSQSRGPCLPGAPRQKAVAPQSTVLGTVRRRLVLTDGIFQPTPQRLLPGRLPRAALMPRRSRPLTTCGRTVTLRTPHILSRASAPPRNALSGKPRRLLEVEKLLNTDRYVV